MAYNPNNPNGQATMASSAPVVIASDQTAVPVSGTFWQTTQPVSGTVAVTQATAASLNATVIGTGTFAVQAAQSGTWNLTNISGTISLPTGAATSAKQPALGTAGTASSDVITVQGISGMTALKVDGSAVTQPVSGTFWQATQPVSIAAAVTVAQPTAANLNATVVGTGTFAVQADTELPAAAALADGTSNPTSPIVGSALLAYNGTTWDRVRTDGTDNDSDPVATTGVLSVEAHLQGFNGTSFDRIRTQDAVSGTGANDTVVGIQAVSSGPGYAIRYNPTNLATAANSTSAINIEGANTSVWGISTTTTGTIIFEGTADNTNWYSIETFDATADAWVTNQNLTPTAGKVYYVACSGLRQVRIRTVSTLGATVAHFVTLTNGGQVLSAIDTGYAPHNFGYTLVHKDGEYTTAQTGTIIWTPTSGKKFAITDITVSVGGTTSGIVTIFDAASGTTTYTAGTTPAIFRAVYAPSTNSSPGTVKSFNVPYVSTAANNVVHVTTSAAMTVYLQINGYEI